MEIFLDKIEYEYELRILINAFYGRNHEVKFYSTIDFPTINRSDEYLIIKKRDNTIFGSVIKHGQLLYNKESTLSNQIDEKQAYKKMIYILLSQFLMKKLPWGTLTGIRPTKIIEKFWKHEENIDNFLKNNYFISDDKLALSKEIFLNQKKIKEEISSQIAVYIHIPFCPSRCNYCSFFSIENKDGKAFKLIDDYLEALKKELLKEKDFFQENKKKIQFLYIGGGTPSSLSEVQLTKLFDILNEFFDTTYLKEFTFEAGRPDTLNKEKLEILKINHISRISINPQTMNDDTLKKIGRHHTAQQVEDVFFLARQIGFNNINMDIILGLEDETVEHVNHTLEKIRKLAPDSLTVHTLALKRGSKLNENPIEDEINWESEKMNQYMNLATKYARDMNLIPYYLYRQKNMRYNLENTGFSKENKLCYYNIGMMEDCMSVLSYGSGAVSKFYYPDENRIERIFNTKDIHQYINNVSVADMKNKQLKDVQLQK